MRIESLTVMDAVIFCKRDNLSAITHAHISNYLGSFKPAYNSYCHLERRNIWRCFSRYVSMYMKIWYGLSSTLNTTLEPVNTDFYCLHNF